MLIFRNYVKSTLPIYTHKKDKYYSIKLYQEIKAKHSKSGVNNYFT